MENNNYTENIHRYLNGTMANEEKSQFENDLKQYQALKQAVELERKILLGLEKLGDHELRKQIQDAHQNLEGQGFFESRNNIIPINSKPKLRLMKRIVAIAAAAVVILGLAWWGFFREKPMDANAIFAQNFQPETDRLGAVMAGFPAGFAGEPTPQDSLKEALKLYEAGKYNEAAAALDSVLVKHPANDTAMFYLAMSHLNMERYSRALEILTPLSAQDGTAFKLDATWYLGLCYLKVDNGLAQAKEIFGNLAANPDYKDRQSANGILHLLEK